MDSTDSKMVTSFHIQLDCQFLAVVDVCQIETCCTAMYDRISCSQKQILRRVEAYQWFKFSTFCRQVMQAYKELTECYQSLKCDHAELVELRYPMNKIHRVLDEFALVKSALRQHCVMSKQDFGDWVAETIEVTQTSYEFWKDILKVEAKKIKYLVDERHAIGRLAKRCCFVFGTTPHSIQDSRIFFRVKIHRISLRAMDMFRST